MTVSVTSTEAQEGPVTLGLLGPDAGKHRRGLRRHRNLAALRVSRGGGRRGARTGRSRRVIVLGVLVADPVGALHRRHRQIRLLLLRADNNGEGGTLSLMALGQRALGRRSWPLLALGVVGASMFIGDSMITPAISVLSAVEGLKLATPALEHYVVPLTIFILVVLFSVQSSGTARVASAFGPVMVVWFASLAVMGLVHISDDPSVLAAINPWYGAAIPAVPRHDRPGDAGRGVSRGDRRRGALCRSRPFRPQADPVRLAVLRAARAADQLFRAGRAGAVRSRRDREFVLPDGARDPAAAAGRAGDRGDRDREPGGDHRRLFAGPPGGATRPAAALRGPLHLRDRMPGRSICRASTGCC